MQYNWIKSNLKEPFLKKNPDFWTIKDRTEMRFIGKRRSWEIVPLVRSDPFVTSNRGEKNPDFLLRRASSPSISPPSRAESLAFFSSPPRTYAPERVICRPDLGNRGSVLDLSTRTQDVGSGCPYAADKFPYCGRRLTRDVVRSIGINTPWISCTRRKKRTARTVI